MSTLKGMLLDSVGLAKKANILLFNSSKELSNKELENNIKVYQNKSLSFKIWMDITV